jgi:dodecin
VSPACLLAGFSQKPDERELCSRRRACATTDIRNTAAREPKTGASRTGDAHDEKESLMPNKTYKIIEVVGVSEDSVQQAVRNAITKARQTIRNIDWFEVKNIRGSVNKAGDPTFQVEVRIGFRLEGDPVV